MATIEVIEPGFRLQSQIALAKNIDASMEVFMSPRSFIAITLLPLIAAAPGCGRAPEDAPAEIRIVCGTVTSPYFEGEATEGTAEFDALIKRADEDKNCILKQTNLPD